MIEQLRPLQLELSAAVDLVLEEVTLPEQGDEGGPGEPGCGVDALPLRNYVDVEYEVEKAGKTQIKTRRKPRRSADILAEVQARTGGWPRVVGGVLFIEGPDHRPRLLETAAAFIAWLDEIAPVDLQRGGPFVTQERFWEFVPRQGPAVRLDRVPAAQPAVGGCLLHAPCDARGRFRGHQRLLEFFSPATGVDRCDPGRHPDALLGGEPGARPAFLFTGPPDDPEQGRGLGKSKLVDLIATELYGGSIDVQASSDIDAFKTRALSPAAASRRIARLDNVKTHRFSWADYEGVLTAADISGWRLYHGEGCRRNLLTWFITLNGASLSKDIAMRVIPIVLRRPTYRAAWEGEVLAHIRENRWAILAEIGAILDPPPTDLAARTRWACWEQRVLSAGGQPGEVPGGDPRAAGRDGRRRARPRPRTRLLPRADRRETSPGCGR